MRNLFY